MKMKHFDMKWHETSDMNDVSAFFFGVFFKIIRPTN